MSILRELLVLPLDPVTSFQGSPVVTGLSAKGSDALNSHKPFDSIGVFGDYLKDALDLAGVCCDRVLLGIPGIH
jgi:hypothetical protein